MSRVLYEDDFYSWTQEQATLLRAGRLDELDLHHVAEEIESLGISQRHQLVSRLEILLTHLLKWHYQPRWQGPSWRRTIREQRRRIVQLLESSPGLQPGLIAALDKAYAAAREDASDETGLTLRTFPEVCPFTVEQLLDAGFWPQP
jgi:hypothetical protein